MKKRKPSKVSSWFSRPTFDISRALERKAADVRRKMVAKKAELAAEADAFDMMAEKMVSDGWYEGPEPEATADEYYSSLQVGYGTEAPSTPVEYPDMPETRRVWLQTEAARREAAYFDAHPDERPKGGLVKVSTLLKAWFPMGTP